MEGGRSRVVNEANKVLLITSLAHTLVLFTIGTLFRGHNCYIECWSTVLAGVLMLTYTISPSMELRRAHNNCFYYCVELS